MLFMETKKQTAIMAIVRKKISFLEEVSRKLEKTMDSIEEELLIDKEEQAKELWAMIIEPFESLQLKGGLMNDQENQCKQSRDD